MKRIDKVCKHKWYRDRVVTKNGKKVVIWRCSVCGTEREG